MKATAFLLALSLTSALWCEPLALRKLVYDGTTHGLGEAMMVDLHHLGRVFEIDLGQSAVSDGHIMINGQSVTAEESGSSIFVNVKEFAQATGLSYQWNEAMSRFEVDRPSKAVVNYLPPEERPKQPDRYGQSVTHSSNQSSNSALAKIQNQQQENEARARKSQQDWKREQEKVEKARAKQAQIASRGQDYVETRDPKTDLVGFKKNGQWVIRPKFKTVTSFNCGYACAKMPDTVTKRKVTEAVNRTYEEVTQTTYNGVPLGMARPTGRTETRTEYETRTVTKITEHDKWGIISLSGEWSCSPKFDRTLTFRVVGDEILAEVYDNGKTIYYTPQGTRVNEPRQR